MALSKLRKPIREVLALSIWAHAIFATDIIGVPSVRWAFVPSYAYDFSLIGFIIFYSLISPSGWLSVIFDLFYAYLWPFIWLFRLLFALWKYLWKVANKHDLIPRNFKQIEVDTRKAIEQNKTNPVPTPEREPYLKTIFRSLGQFSLVWCLVILNTKSNILAVIGIIFAIIGAARATYGIWGVIAGALDFIADLKTNIAVQISNACGLILEWDMQSGTDKVRNAAGTIHFFSKVFSFLAEKKATVTKLTSLIALIITVPFYLYISSVFACVYLGLAKVQHLSLDWKSALTNSLFIPIAFTDMPHGLVIRLVAGIHAIAIGAMGYNVLFRHFNSKVDAIADAANELRRPIIEGAVAQRLVMINAPPEKSEIAVDNKSQSIS